MKKIIFIGVTIAVIALGALSCSKHKGYKETDSGLYYKFYQQNKDSLAAQMGDVLTLTLIYKTETDSVVEDSRTKPFPFRVILRESQYKADLYEGLAMMRQGDSASFIIKADSFYLVTAGFPNLPEFVTPETKLIFDVKLQNIQPKAEFELEMAEMQKIIEQQAQQNKEKEPELIKKYIADNNIKVKPTASGLYYIELQKGTGKQAMPGSTCKVHYKGTFFDGTIFDSSEGREPFTFVIGKDAVIEGWHQGIAMMRAGGKAKLILPSSLAYGERGAGNNIPPFTPLVFEVELIDVQ